MLVLTRKTSQSIIIDSPRTGKIEVFGVELHGDQVRLGIKVQQSVPVHRTEVYLHIQQENLATSQPPAEALPEETE